MIMQHNEHKNKKQISKEMAQIYLHFTEASKVK